MSFIRPNIIRPPSEAGCYFLPLTAGCSNNSCTFCNYYYGYKLKIRDLADIKNEIDIIHDFVENGSQNPDLPYIAYSIADEWDGRRIFLQDGDALVYPFQELKDILEYVNAKFPDLDRIACYGTPQDILRLTHDQLRILLKNKLKIIYMGVESGDDDVLLNIDKRVTSSQIIEAGKKVRESGILLSVTVILGLGSIEGSEKHTLKTAEILTSLDPEYAGALTLTLVPGTPLYDKCKSGKFTVISPFQSLQELKTIIEHATFTNCFFSSMHASNYLSIRGNLPQDKAEMLDQIEFVLSSKNPELLKPEFMRGL
jgi:radical SAM superfamily enzyme YgiQ (UPF0313 family)